MGAMGMFENPENRHLAKIALCGVGALLVLVYYFVRTGKLRGGGRLVFDVGLVALALLSVAAYFEFGVQRFNIYMNPHDVYHYYIGAKYSPETRYHDLYRASLIADRELGALFKNKTIRNLDNHTFEATTAVLAQSEAIKSHFSPARWEEFKKDIAYFRGLVPSWKWNDMLRDKGYNGAPVWNATARWIANHAATDDVWAMRAITYLDLVLLLIMLGGVWWAFGWRTMLFIVIFHDVNYFMAFVHIKGAFLRLDWFVMCVLAACLLKKGWHTSAGVALAWAAMARVFPALFAFGLGVKLFFNVVQVWWTRNRPESERVAIDWHYVRFFAGFTLAAAVFAGGSVMADGGTMLWQAFLSKIELHNNDISSTRVGFKYIFVAGEADKAGVFAQKQLLYKGILGVVVLATMLLVRRAKDYEAFLLGFIPFFFFVAPTFYYFVILMLPFMYFVCRAELPERALGAALTFALSAYCFWLGRSYDQNFQLFYLESWLLLGLLGYMAICALIPRHRLETAVSGVTIDAPPVVRDREPAGELAMSSGQGDQRPVEPEGDSAISGIFQFALGTLMAWAVAAVAVFALSAAVGKPVNELFKRSSAAPTAQTNAVTAAAKAPEAPKAPEATSAADTSKAPEAPKAADAPAGPKKPESAPPVSIPGSKAADEVELLFVGDVMMNRGVSRTLAQHNLPYTFPFETTAPIISAADIAFANLECPVSGRGEKLEKKRYVFNAKPETVDGLASAGFDIVSLANNHTLDYGPTGLDDTLANLAKKSILPIGVTTNDDPQTPVILEKNGVKIGYLAYADPVPGYSYAEEFYAFEKRPAKGTREIIARDIAALRPQVDVLVVSMHWGIEYSAPTQQEIDLGHYIIDQGANIVAGHHPHVQQPAQLYNKGLIIYSMGNFVFDQRKRKDTRVSTIYRAYVGKDGFRRAERLPLTIPIDVWQPKPTAKEFAPVTSTEAPKSKEAFDAARAARPLSKLPAGVPGPPQLQATPAPSPAAEPAFDPVPDDVPTPGDDGGGG